MDDPLFPTTYWRPLPRPGGPEHTVPVTRREVQREAGSGPPCGPEVLSRHGAEALVRFRHHAPHASAVALQANGWWRPVPADACDLHEVGEGWWEGTFVVPATWRASYAFAVHEGPGQPPWWREGLKRTAVTVEPDHRTSRGHRASRGGALRSVITLPEDGPFGRGSLGGDPAPALHSLDHLGLGERVRWWASRPGDPGCDLLRGEDPLPLLIVTDGAQHVDLLGTPQLLRGGVASGVLPPLAAVFIDSGDRRAEVLGVPGGHACWIAETLVPRVQADGLRGLGTREGGREDESCWAARVPVTSDPSHVVVTGSSFGGLTALFALARAPHLIGAAIAQSVSLWRYPPGALAEPVIAAARRAAEADCQVRLRLQAGTFEGSMPADATTLLEQVRARSNAEQLPVDAGFSLHSGGHDWAWWQPEMLHSLADLLR